jgi:hypothetical protein
MNLYRVSLRTEGDTGDGHAGYQFYPSKRKAEQAAAEWEREQSKGGIEGAADVEQIHVQTTRRGILYALNRYASHNDNG